MTFRAKLILSMCGLVLFAGALILVAADRGNRAITDVLAGSLFREVSNHAVVQTRDFVSRAAPVAQSLQQLAGQGLATDDLDRLSPQLLAFLKGNPGMTWVLYADESGDYTGATRLHDGRLHVERTHIVGGRTHLTEYEVNAADGTWKLFQQDDNRGYDPRTRPFYVLAKERGGLAWTPPYMFFSQGVPGISCVIPVNDAGGKLRGVFSVEFDLNALSEFVAALSVSEHSRVFLFTRDQTLLAHPNQRKLAASGVKGQGALLTLADTGDPLVDAFRQHVRPDFLLGSAGTSGSGTGGSGMGPGDKASDFHFFQFDHDRVGYMASTSVFPIGDGQSWVVGVVAPQSDFLAAVWRTRWTGLAVALAALLLAMAFAAALARRVSEPVQALIAFMHRVGDGNLEVHASFKGSREFRQLSEALNRMIGDLRDRLRLRHSLDVAMQVQQQLLPRNPPKVPGLDIAGHSTYCDETGGDYYDFVVIDEPDPGNVLVVLGDVMGHGVAAALVMAGARAVLRDRASVNTPDALAQLMGRLNKMIAADLDGTRFMTMHLGIMNVPRRTYRWSSAGHDAPIIFDPATGSFDEPDGGDLPLGVMEDTAYDEQTIGPLKFGQVLLVGSDGVWEMPNAAGEAFGKVRLRNVIRDNADGSATQISDALRDALTAFRGDVKSVDDVTFVILKAVPVHQPEDSAARSPELESVTVVTA